MYPPAGYHYPQVFVQLVRHLFLLEFYFLNIYVRVTFDGTLTFRRKCLETCYVVISRDRTDRCLVELQEMLSCVVAGINTYLPIVVSFSLRTVAYRSSSRAHVECLSQIDKTHKRRYSIDFSVTCLTTKIASVQDLHDMNPCCSSTSEIRSFILFVIIF